MSISLPIISVSDPVVVEGDAGTTPVIFEVTLSAPLDQDLALTALVIDNASVQGVGPSQLQVLEAITPGITLTAISNADYLVPATTDVVIPAGTTAIAIPVEVLGDTRREPNDDFALVIQGFDQDLVVGDATPGLDFGVATILDDDPFTLVNTDNALVVDVEGFGRMIWQLREDLAPATVARLIELADQDFYDGLTFHRIVEGFVAQGGDPNGDGTGGSGTDLIAEFTDSSFTRGTLGIARVAADPNSGDSQFFIVTDDALFLDGEFTLFGTVADGLDVADAFPIGEPPASPPVIRDIRAVTLTLFDGDRYVASNADLTAAGFTAEDGLEHFLAIGRNEGRPLNFSAQDYLAANPDLAQAGLTEVQAAEHFLSFGQFEGRLRSFDADQYLAIHPDLAAAGVTSETAFAHFFDFGRQEGRIFNFDDVAYLAANPDLAAAGLDTFEEALAHYVNFGRDEGRGFLDGETYLRVNPDVASAGLFAEVHYETNGRFEGRAATLKGTAYGDLLVGTPQDDFLRGLGGDDTLVGGEGADTAVFDDLRANYAFQADGDQIIATHLRGGEGVDTLIDIENVRFLDGTFSIDDLLI